MNKRIYIIYIKNLNVDQLKSHLGNVLKISVSDQFQFMDCAVLIADATDEVRLNKEFFARDTGDVLGEFYDRCFDSTATYSLVGVEELLEENDLAFEISNFLFFSIAFAENKCMLLSCSEPGLSTDVLLHRDGKFSRPGRMN